MRMESEDKSWQVYRPNFERRIRKGKLQQLAGLGVMAVGALMYAFAPEDAGYSYSVMNGLVLGTGFGAFVAGFLSVRWTRRSQEAYSGIEKLLEDDDPLPLDLSELDLPHDNNTRMYDDEGHTLH